MVEKRLGNITGIAYVRGFLENNSQNDFPLLLERLVYNGTHCGDRIAAPDVPQLMEETRKLQSVASDPIILEFTNHMVELAKASFATGNPIVF